LPVRKVSDHRKGGYFVPAEDDEAGADDDAEEDDFVADSVAVAELVLVLAVELEPELALEPLGDVVPLLDEDPPLGDPPLDEEPPVGDPPLDEDPPPDGLVVDGFGLADEVVGVGVGDGVVFVGVSDGLGECNVEADGLGEWLEPLDGGFDGLVGGLLFIGVVSSVSGSGAPSAGPSTPPSTEPKTRVAWNSLVQRTGTSRTFSPVRGASTIMPLPAYMATWWMPRQLLE